MLVGALSLTARAQENRSYKVYQFSANMIPRIGGRADDWASFPAQYVVGTDQLRDESGHYPRPESTNLNVRLRVA